MGRRLASARLAAHLQGKVEDHAYGDTAAVLSYTVATLDTYGQPNTTTTTTAISCSFTDSMGAASMEKWKNYADIKQIVAEIRFTSPVPSNGMEVTLKGRFDGTGYPDKTYEIIAIRNRDAFGYVCALKVAEL